MHAMQRFLSVFTRPIIVKTAIILVILSATVLVLLPVSPANMPVAYRDSGVFLYVGWRILNGAVPYRDAFDQKPPVIFYINALGLAISNGSRWGVWAIEFISLFTAAFLCFHVINKAFGFWPGILSLYLWMLGLVFLLDGGNYTTEYVLPMQFGCLYLAVKGELKKKTGWSSYLIGALTGLALFTKPNTIGIGIAIGLYWIVDRWFSARRKQLWLDLGLMLAGALSVIGVILAVLALQGALPYFWEAVVRFNVPYTQIMSIPANWLNSAYRIILNLATTNLFLLGMTGWGVAVGILLFARQRISITQRALLGIALLDLPIECVLVSMLGRRYIHYYITLLPVFGVMTAVSIYVFIEGLKSWLNWSGNKRYQLALIVVIATTLVFTQINPFRQYRTQVGYWRDNNGIPGVVQTINQLSKPTDFLLVTQSEAYINFAAKRISPSRFVYQTPLYLQGYASPHITKEYLQDILRNKPALILSDSGVWFDLDALKAVNGSSPEVEALLDQIDKQYTSLGVFYGWLFLKYNGESQYNFIIYPGRSAPMEIVQPYFEAKRISFQARRVLYRLSP